MPDDNTDAPKVGRPSKYRATAAHSLYRRASLKRGKLEANASSPTSSTWTATITRSVAPSRHSLKACSRNVSRLHSESLSEQLRIHVSLQSDWRRCLLSVALFSTGGLQVQGAVARD